MYFKLENNLFKENRFNLQEQYFLSLYQKV